MTETIRLARDALCFFAAVIKCGESWSETCDTTLRSALAAIDKELARESASQTPSTPPWLTPAVQERAMAEVQRVLAEEGIGSAAKELKAALERCIEAHETGRFEPSQIAYESAQNTIADLVTEVPDFIATQIVLAVLAACVSSVDDAAVERALNAWVHRRTSDSILATDRMRRALLAAMRGE
jgi:hypothetical protein